MIMESSLPKDQSKYDLQEFLSGFNNDSEVKKILKQIGVRPSKGMGQNFLIDPSVSESIVGALNIDSDDIIVDVRSASRVGRSDFGKNVTRIRDFLEKLKNI